MNLSIYTGDIISQNFSAYVDGFRCFYEKGVRFGDMVDDALAHLPLHLYCSLMRRGGIVPEALVSLLDIASFSEMERERNIAKIKGYIDQMEKLDIPILQLAPTVEPADDKKEIKKMQSLLIESFQKIIDYSEGSGVSVTVENNSSLQRADSRMKDIRYILDCVPKLGFVLDTGNFFCIGEDVLAAYELLKDRMVHMHCKDWVFNPYGHFVRENMPRFEGVPAGDGVIPLKELFGLLRKDGYKGNVVIETNAKIITVDMLYKSAEFILSEISL